MKLTTNPTQIQIARGVILGKQMHAESIYKDMRYDADKVMRLALGALNAENRYVLIIAHSDDDPNDVVGFMFGSVGPHFFSDELVAKDYALFVKKDKRGGIAAMRLLKKFEQLAKEKGAGFSMLAAATGVEPERTLELFERLDYQRIGGICVKQLRT